jgi:phosphoribosylformylglycinamidine synthase
VLEKDVEPLGIIMSKPKALIIRTAGTNCDYETAHAFELAGAKPRRVHVNRLINGEVKLSQFDIMAFPGGFSYGDDIASGKILANEIKYKFGDNIRKFALSGKPIIGICNGFQVLVKMGLLPDEEKMHQSATLTYNDSDKFECRWVYLKANQKLKVKNQNFWLKNLPEIIELPVAHAEGKFVVEDKKVLSEIKKNEQIVFQYVDAKGRTAGYPSNPNGSLENIAGICSAKGNIFGLMPHPERCIYKWHHFQRSPQKSSSEYAWGLQIFKNAVDYIK